MKIIRSKKLTDMIQKKASRPTRGIYETTINGPENGLKPPYQFPETEEVDISVYYNATPGSPAVWYRRNGDPGDPAEDPEIEIWKVIRRDSGEDVIDTIEQTNPAVFYSLVNDVAQQLDEQESEQYDEPDPGDMDGDFDTGMRDAGFGTDEDYGYFGGDEF